MSDEEKKAPYPGSFNPDAPEFRKTGEEQTKSSKKSHHKNKKSSDSGRLSRKSDNGIGGPA
jgi:hypothetical protein